MNLLGGAPGPRTESGDRGAGLLLGAALVAVGLLAGVYFAFAVSVMPALADVDDRTFIDTMQHIDDAIQNPVFFLSVFGSLIFPAVSAVLERRAGLRDAAAWVIAALIFSALAFLVTIAFNIPLNEDLVNVGDPAAIANPSLLAGARDDFEDPWVAWNIVRTVASTAALACLGRALVLHGRIGR